MVSESKDYPENEDRVLEDGVLLTRNEYGLLLQALNNYNQEIGGAHIEEKSLREGAGVTEMVFVEDFAAGLTDIVVQHQHLSADDNRFAELMGLLEASGVEFSDDEFHVCECGNITIPSDPTSERDFCNECGSEVPYYRENSQEEL